MKIPFSVGLEGNPYISDINSADNCRTIDDSFFHLVFHCDKIYPGGGLRLNWQSTDNLEKIRLENYKTTETAVGHVLGYNRALNEIIDFLPNHTK